MRNVGTISESRRSSKVYPLVSDRLFERKVKLQLQELTPAGEEAAELRKREKEAEERGDYAAAGRAMGARQSHLATRRARPKVPAAGRVPGKRYRDDRVSPQTDEKPQTNEMKKRMPKKGGGS